MLCEPRSTPTQPTVVVEHAGVELAVDPSHSCVLVDAVGPQMCHEIDPVKELRPVTVTVVLSLTAIAASLESAGIVDAGEASVVPAVAASTGLVTVVE